MNPFFAELAVAQPRHRVIFVKPLLRLGRRLDVPFDQRRPHRRSDLGGEHGLAGAWLTLDEQWTAQRRGGVDRDLEVVGGDVAGSAFEAHKIPLIVCVRYTYGDARGAYKCDGCDVTALRCKALSRRAMPHVRRADPTGRDAA